MIGAQNWSLQWWFCLGIMTTPGTCSHVWCRKVKKFFTSWASSRDGLSGIKLVWSKFFVPETFFWKSHDWGQNLITSVMILPRNHDYTWGLKSCLVPEGETNLYHKAQHLRLMKPENAKVCPKTTPKSAIFSTFFPKFARYFVKWPLKATFQILLGVLQL